MSANYQTQNEGSGMAAQAGLRPRRLKSGKGRIFTTMLFAVIVLFLLLLLLVGVNVYQTVNDTRTSSNEARLGLSLLGNTVRMNDTTDAVGIGNGPEGSSLVLTEYLSTGTYETRIYAYEGSIVQEYSSATSAYTPEKAREVTKSERFEFSYENGLLTIYTDQGETAVSLRSVRGRS